MHLLFALVSLHVLADLIWRQHEGFPAPVALCAHILLILQDLEDLGFAEHHDSSQQPLFRARALELWRLLCLVCSSKLAHHVLANGVRPRLCARLHLVEVLDVGLHYADLGFVPTRQECHQPALCMLHMAGLCVPLHAETHGSRRLLTERQVLHHILGNFAAFELGGASVWRFPVWVRPGDAQSRVLSDANQLRHCPGICAGLANKGAAVQSG
mmetsp:Transcript_87031/g.156753  ORF Transcript_87031/g.156753 Transcript_87031/m.156753 type:complete len:213 (+) Transcript_87031:257-895(+)